MQKISVVYRIILAVFVLFLSGCGDSGSTSNTNNNSDAQVNETSVNEVSDNDLVPMNNCGNPASIEQPLTRSATIDVGGGVDVNIPQIAKASVTSKYGNTAQVQSKLTAAPNTNMKFVIKWVYEVRAGNVTTNGSTTPFSVKIPKHMEIVSANDIGCDPESGTSDSSSDSPVLISAYCGYDGDSPVNVNVGQDVILYTYFQATTEEYLQDYLKSFTVSIKIDGEEKDLSSADVYPVPPDSEGYYYELDLPVTLPKGIHQVDYAEYYNSQFTDGVNSYEAGTSWEAYPTCIINVQ